MIYYVSWLIYAIDMICYTYWYSDLVVQYDLLTYYITLQLYNDHQLRAQQTNNTTIRSVFIISNRKISN